MSDELDNELDELIDMRKPIPVWAVLRNMTAGSDGIMVLDLPDLLVLWLLVDAGVDHCSHQWRESASRDLLARVAGDSTFISGVPIRRTRDCTECSRELWLIDLRL